MSRPTATSGSVTAGSGAHRPPINGITGGIGVGKSVLAEVLRARGAIVISTDEITHELLNNPGPAYDEVLQRFGSDLVSAPGTPIDRALLAQRAFASAKDKADLEGILYPRIDERIEQIRSGCTESDDLFTEVPRLHEEGLKPRFLEVWCVVAPEAIQVQQIMRRDNVTEEVARFRISQHEMSQDEKARNSDVVLVNDSTLDDFKAKCNAAYDAYLERKRQRLLASTQAPDPTANDRYREVFQTLGTIGVEEALAKLGDVAGTRHKKAKARLSMNVDSSDGGDPAASRRLEVEVSMQIRNDPGGTSEGGCSCGCGPECRVSCACQPDCGCGCTPPPPRPPQPPCPPPGERRSRLWLAVIALIALLAFLFAVIVVVGMLKQPHTSDSGKIVIVTPPCSGPCTDKDPDPKDDGGPFKPPKAPPPVVKPCKPCGKHVVNEIPEYAFRATHNAVRVQLRSWEVSDGGTREGATVAGYDAEHKLLVYQEFDKDYWLVYQWVFTYFPDGTTQVDRFEGKSNIFVGRTVYRYRSGLLARVEQYDGMQRLLFTATYLRSSSGTPLALTVETVDTTSGAALSKRTIAGLDAVETYLKENFYAYSMVNP